MGVTTWCKMHGRSWVAQGGLVIGLVGGLVGCGGSATNGEAGSAKTSLEASRYSGSQENLVGVPKSTRQPNYGRPRDVQARAEMAKRLGTFFDGRHALSTEPASASPMHLRKAGSLAPQSVYRFLNTQTGVHFFTASIQERDWVRANLAWFQYEGPAFFALPVDDTALTPVFRFYNKISGTHFYTVSAIERDEVIAKFSDIFNFEGVSWYASAQNGAGWRPIFRFFNTQTGTHFYSASPQERDNILSSLPQYRYEGIGYFVRLGAETFTPQPQPLSCSTSPAPVLSAALPTQFGATLIRKVDTVERPFLNNQGDVAFVHRDLTQGTRVLQYRAFNDGQLRSVVVPDSASTSPSDDLISLNDAGEMLLAQRSADVMPGDQTVALGGRPDALRYQPGGAFLPVTGLKIPTVANHRAGRHTFFEAMSAPNDGSGRVWAWNSMPSYLNGGVVVQTSDILYLANRQLAVNHCGWGLDMSGRTEGGLIWMNGNIEMGRWHFSFTHGQDASLRVLGTNNRRAVVGYSVDFPVADKVVGYLKYGPAQERVFNNFVPSDVNEKLVAVGSQVELLSASPPSIRELGGAIFTTDGAPQLLKERVPALNQAGTKIFPLRINDNMRILASVVLACDPLSNANALGDACGSSYLYLLSPS